MIVVFSDTTTNHGIFKPITYYGSLRVHVDTSSLGLKFLKKYLHISSKNTYLLQWS